MTRDHCPLLFRESLPAWTWSPQALFTGLALCASLGFPKATAGLSGLQLVGSLVL